MVTVTIVFSLLSDSEKVGQPWVKLTSEEKGPLWSQPASLNKRWLEAVRGTLKPRRESACRGQSSVQAKTGLHWLGCFRGSW